MRPAPTRLDELLARGDPGHPALTHAGRTLTYGALSAEVARVAAGLRGLGVRRGDRVAVFAEKRLETVVAMLAVSAAGAVLVPVNPLFKPAQVRHVLADCTATVLITTTARERSLVAMSTVDSITAVVVLGPAADPHCVAWDRLPGGPGTEATATDTGIDTDLAAIFYTSGSTGGPKGVVLTHRNLIAGAESVAGYLGHTSEDVLLAVLPLSFDAGFSQLTTTFAAGAHVVLVNYLRPREVVTLCAKHKVTGLTGVPPLWLQLTAQDWPTEAVSSLRYFANTGGRMPGATLDALRKAFPSALPYLMYGLTEAFRSTYLDPAAVDDRPGSIGKAVPNAEVLVVRPDGTVCDPGEEGEIVHRGAFVARGYWNDPHLSARRFRPYPPDDPGADLAVFSGDRAYRDEDGFLYFVGRADEMIKTSGYRVSPSEIEDTAYATGLVTEAVAFGMPDDALGQHIVLAVSGTGVGDPAALTTVLTAALSRSLPAYMVPRTVLACAPIPRSGNGKFDLAALRAMVSP